MGPNIPPQGDYTIGRSSPLPSFLAQSRLVTHQTPDKNAIGEVPVPVSELPHAPTPPGFFAVGAAGVAAAKILRPFGRATGRAYQVTCLSVADLLQ